MIRRAFTLIELLVVIAIIAILAAILFPVFAKAKEAAIETKLISNYKQMGVGVLLYADSQEDMIPLSMYSGKNADGTFFDLAWQDLIYPFVKSWDVMLHAKRAAPKVKRADQIQFQRIQHFAIPPRAAINIEPVWRNQNYYAKDWIGGVGRPYVRFDGLAGFGSNEAKDWLGRVPGPSYTLSQIANPADTIMVVEAQNWDLWWSVGPYALDYCLYWDPPTQWSSYGKRWGWAGPAAYKNPKSPDLVGHSAMPNCRISLGWTTFAAVDGSVRVQHVRTGVMAFEPIEGTNENILTKFWPSGTKQ